jgi:serine/threonine protein phosphatase PrpC
MFQNLGSREDTVFLGVFDGHGPRGHIVGRRVRDTLPSMLVNQWHELLSAENLNTDGNDTEVTESYKSNDASNQDQKEEEPKIFAVWKESYLRAFKVMDKELKLHPTLDCFCSGSTAVTIVKQVI